MPGGFLAVTLMCIILFAPASVASITEEADAELDAGHFKKACELYRLALATHRTDATVLLNAARAYEGAGDIDEAISRAREATTFEPKNAYAHLALAHYLDANRDHLAALVQYETVTDLKSATAEERKAAYGPLLRLLKHEKEFAKLVKTARQAAREFKDDADAHYNLGWALSQQPIAPGADARDKIKVRLEAIAEFRKSVALKEKRTEVFLELARLLQLTGDRAAAREELAKYLRATPDAANDKDVKALDAELNKGN